MCRILSSKLSNPCFGRCPSHLTDSLCGTLSSKYPRIGVFKHQWVGQMDLDVPDTVQQISMHWIASSKVDYSKLSNPCFGRCPSHLTDSLCGALSSKYPRIGVFKHQWVGQMDLDVPDTVQQISMHWISSSKVDNPNGLKSTIM